MRIIKSIIIAFSMYSRIPMPQFAWKDEDMKYMLCFFPWVGAVIGIVVYLWKQFCVHLKIGTLCYVLLGMATPLLITGGFHVDGFMDTMDAFHSYQTRERKLEILKDSHIGAFAVIMSALYGLVYMGAFSEITKDTLLKIFCAGFMLARCFSGIGVVSFKTAKQDGMLFSFASHAQKRMVKLCLYVQGAFCAGFMLWEDVFAGSMAVAAAAVAFVYYYIKCKKELGGITGDTAGYFILICEESILLAVAASGVI